MAGDPCPHTRVRTRPTGRSNTRARVWSESAQPIRTRAGGASWPARRRVHSGRRANVLPGGKCSGCADGECGDAVGQDVQVAAVRRQRKSPRRIQRAAGSAAESVVQAAVSAGDTAVAAGDLPEGAAAAVAVEHDDGVRDVRRCVTVRASGVIAMACALRARARGCTGRRHPRGRSRRGSEAASGGRSPARARILRRPSRSRP